MEESKGKREEARLTMRMGKGKCEMNANNGLSERVEAKSDGRKQRKRVKGKKRGGGRSRRDQAREKG